MRFFSGVGQHAYEPGIDLRRRLVLDFRPRREPSRRPLLLFSEKQRARVDVYCIGTIYCVRPYVALVHVRERRVGCLQGIFPYNLHTSELAPAFQNENPTTDLSRRRVGPRVRPSRFHIVD